MYIHAYIMFCSVLSTASQIPSVALGMCCTPCGKYKRKLKVGRGPPKKKRVVTSIQVGLSVQSSPS